MRILVFNIAKPKEAAALFAIGIAEGLKSNNVEVYAFLQENVQNRKEWDSLLDENHIYYTHLNNDEQSHIRQLFDLYTKERKKIKHFFKGIEFDYVITTVYANWSHFILPLFKTKSKVVVCHDPLPHSGENKFNAFLAKLYYVESNKIVVLTKRFTEIAKKRFYKSNEDVIYIPHGRTNSYSIVANKSKPIIYSADNYNFLFFGRIEKYKGLTVLGEAYKKVSEKYSNITLTVAGSGNFSEFQKLYNTLPNTRLLIRYIEDNEVEGLFDGPNVIVVVPYLDATQSGIISIALEYGNVVIASDTGGLKEQLNDGRIGLFFSPGDIDGLAKQMVSIIENNNIIQEQKRLESAYLKNLNWDIVMKMFLDSI